MESISGSKAFAIFIELKKRYGVKQSAIAGVLKISRQAVTDMKADRRRFTREMANKLVQAYGKEPWHAWFHTAIYTLFIDGESVPKEGAYQNEAPGLDATHDKPAAAIGVNADSLLMLPVLPAPWRGDPLQAPFDIQEFAAIPPQLAVHAAPARNPYVLSIDFDDTDKRLRRGDFVLAVQDGERESEIQIIEFQDSLRLARRSRGDTPPVHCGHVETTDMDWVLLDSGMQIPSSRAVKVGCVVGIVLALL